MFEKVNPCHPDKEPDFIEHLNQKLNGQEGEADGSQEKEL